MPRYGDLDALQSRLQRNADLYKGCNDADMKARRDEALNAVACVVNAPTADVEPVVHASWVNAEEKPYIRKHFHKKVCSNCFREGQERWKRCPYCEAKMDGREDE